MITGVHHITINVKNLELSKQFYGRMLGLKELESIRMPDHSLYYYALPGIKLELIQYDNDTGENTSGLLERGKFRHLAIETDDIHLIEEELPKYGGKVLQSPKWVEKLQFTGMLVEDPNGCELEFIQK